MSASISPTLNPICRKLIARFAVTVLFPTPPLPEAIAIMFCTPGMGAPLMTFEAVSFDFSLILIFTTTFAFSATLS